MCSLLWHLPRGILMCCLGDIAAATILVLAAAFSSTLRPPLSALDTSLAVTSCMLGWSCVIKDHSSHPNLGRDFYIPIWFFLGGFSIFSPNFWKHPYSDFFFGFFFTPKTRERIQVFPTFRLPKIGASTCHQMGQISGCLWMHGFLCDWPLSFQCCFISSIYTLYTVCVLFAIRSDL